MVGGALELLDEGVTVFDAGLRLVAWNGRFAELLDYPAELLAAGTPYERFVRHNAARGEYGAMDAAGIETEVAARMAAARSFHPHRTRWVRPGGRVLELRGQPLPDEGGFVIFYSDITDLQHRQDEIERHKAELEAHIQRRTAELTAANAELTAAIEKNREITVALRYSEARLRQITDAIPAHIAYVDGSLAYRYANRRYAEWFGWTPARIVGQPVAAVVGPRLFEQVAEPLRRALSGEEVSYEYTLAGTPASADGGERHARSTLVPDFSPAGEVLGCFVHGVDITEQHRTRSAFAQAQKMEAVGQLTGGLAHDFNNMLTVVAGNLNELRGLRADDTVVAEYVEPALLAAGRGAALIRRLLAFARQQPLSPRAVAAGALIHGLTRLLRRSLPENIAILTTAGDPEPVALADPHQLESALLNLALNARDAMPNGGELRIAAGIETLTPAVAADLELASGDYVQISVADNGQGMDGSTLARAFEPFFTTKKANGGSGLGLAMVYGFVKQSGGGVRIRSRQACGTTVALLLPCAEGGDGAADEGLATAGDPARWLQGRMVLLAEDDAEVRRVVRQQLAALGCAVLEAESGDEAADLLETIPAIALLVSDVVMPGSLDGHALARFARGFRPGLPVILMSGYTDAAGSIGDDLAPPLLPKPFTREGLYAALARIAPAMPAGDGDGA
ncbi:PAS domain S-box protein [Pseudothauera rhizosphaerae]|uniref:histidine kinase n=2 Tax=Pseudothauera rhizosphaerae TaxID=2565932 RepID=A0A4S4ADS9_9RHOO|nr:PAS domain S-box protein [Pseudothauera rhizosphaerae]